MKCKESTLKNGARLGAWHHFCLLSYLYLRVNSFKNCYYCLPLRWKQKLLLLTLAQCNGYRIMAPSTFTGWQPRTLSVYFHICVIDLVIDWTFCPVLLLLFATQRKTETIQLSNRNSNKNTTWRCEGLGKFSAATLSNI